MTKQLNTDRSYENYRWFFTSNNVLVVGGKSDEQNEEVIKKFLRADYIIMHTSAPGSPFMIIQSEKPTKSDLEETAIFTGCFSQQWKNSNPKIDIDIFRGSQIYKLKNMKIGTFGVKGEKKTVKIKPELVLIIQKGKLRAVPSPNGDSVLAKIKPGKLSKEEASEKLFRIIKDKFNFPVSKEEIMQAIPSGKLDIK